MRRQRSFRKARLRRTLSRGADCIRETRPAFRNDRRGRKKQKVIMEEKFEYVKAIEELEAIAAKVEDSSTGIGEYRRMPGRNYKSRPSNTW